MATALRIQIDAKDAANELKSISRAFGSFNKALASFEKSIQSLNKLKGVANISKLISADKLAAAADALRIIDRAAAALTPTFQQTIAKTQNVTQTQEAMAAVLKKVGVAVESIQPSLNRAGDAVTKFNVKVAEGKNASGVYEKIRQEMEKANIGSVALAVSVSKSAQSFDRLTTAQNAARDASSRITKFLQTLGVDASQVTVGMNAAGTAIGKVGIVLRGTGDALSIQKAVTNELNAMGQSAHTVSVKFKEAQDNTKGFSEILGGFKTKLLAIGAALSGGAGVKTFITSVVDARVEFQRIENTLYSATGSLEEAQKKFGFVSREAERLGLDLGSLAGQFARFTAAAEFGGLSAEVAQKAFLGVSQAATVLQLSSADTLGVIKALEQIISKGTVSAEELRGQLGDRLPGAFLIAAKAIKTTDETLQQAVVRLRKMLEQGQLTSAEFVEKFGPAMIEAFGGPALLAAQKSLFSNINRLRNDALVTFGAIGKAAEGGFTDVVVSIRGLFQSISSQASLIGETLGFLAKVLSVVIDNFKLFSTILLTLVIVAAVKLNFSLIALGKTLLEKIPVAFSVAEATTLKFATAEEIAAGAAAGLQVALGPLTIAILVLVGVYTAGKIAIQRFGKAQVEAMDEMTSHTNEFYDRWVLIQDAIEAGNQSEIQGFLKPLRDELKQATEKVDELKNKIDELKNARAGYTGDSFEVPQATAGKQEKALNEELNKQQEIVAKNTRQINLLEQAWWDAAMASALYVVDLKETQKETEKVLKALGSVSEATAVSKLSAAFGDVKSQLQALNDIGLNETDKKIRDWNSNIEELRNQIGNLRGALGEARAKVAEFDDAISNTKDTDQKNKLLEKLVEYEEQVAGVQGLLIDSERELQDALAATPNFYASISNEQEKHIKALMEEGEQIRAETAAMAAGETAFKEYTKQLKAATAGQELFVGLIENGKDPMVALALALERIADVYNNLTQQEELHQKTSLKAKETLQEQIDSTKAMAAATLSGGDALEVLSDRADVATKRTAFLKDALEVMGEGGKEAANELADKFEQALLGLKEAERVRKRAEALASDISGTFRGIFDDIRRDGKVNWDRLWDSMLDTVLDTFQQMLEQWIAKLAAMKAAEEAANLGSTASASGGGGGGGNYTGYAGLLGKGAGAVGSAFGGGAATGVIAIIGFAFALWVVYNLFKDSETPDLRRWDEMFTYIKRFSDELSSLEQSMGIAVENVARYNHTLRVTEDNGVYVNNQYLGKFKDAEQAWEAAILAFASQLPSIMGDSLSESVRAVLENVDKLNVASVDDLKSLLELAKKIDRVGLSDTAIAIQDLNVQMAEVQRLAEATGISLEKVNAYRQQELNLIKETAETAINSLIPGFTDLPDRLADAINGVLAFNDALDDLGNNGTLGDPNFTPTPNNGPSRGGGDLFQLLYEWELFFSTGGGVYGQIPHYPGLPGVPGGKTPPPSPSPPDPDGGVPPGAEIGHSTVVIEDSTKAVSAFEEGLQRLIDAAKNAGQEISAIDIDKIRQAAMSVTAQLEQTLGENILQYVNDATIRRQVEHANHVLKMLELQAQFEALKALGTVSQEVLNAYQAAINTIGNLPDSNFGGNIHINTGGGGGKTNQTQTDRDRLKDILADRAFEQSIEGLTKLQQEVAKLNRDREEEIKLAHGSAELIAQVNEQYDHMIETLAKQTRMDAVEAFREFMGLGKYQDSPFQDLKNKFKDLVQQMKDAGFAEDDLAAALDRLTESYHEQLQAILDSEEAGIMDPFQQWIDQTKGIGSFQSELIKTLKQFEDAKQALQDLADDAAAAGLSTGWLAKDIKELENAQKAAIQAIGFDFINSLKSLGASVPTDVILELAQAQWQLAKVEAINAALALAAAGAFEGLSFTLEDLIGWINDASFELSDYNPFPDTPSSGKGGGNGGIDDRQRILDQINAYIKRAGELDMSPLERELQGIKDEFNDLYKAAKEAHVGAAKLQQLTDAYQKFLDDFWKRAYQPVRDAIEELQNTNPQKTQVEAFTDLRDRFLEAVSRAKAGDLSAIQEAADLGLQLRDAGGDFFGTATGAFSNLMDLIQSQLQSILPEGQMAESLDKDQERNNILTDIRDLLTEGFSPNSITVTQSPQQDDREERQTRAAEQQNAKTDSLIQEIRNLRQEYINSISRLERLLDKQPAGGR